MTVFHITATITGMGKVQHVIRAQDDAAAWARFCAAYPRRECVIVKVERRP